MVVRAGGDKRLALLPPERVERIAGIYKESEAEFIGSSFDEGELIVIDNTEGFGLEDYLALATSDYIVEECREEIPHYDNLKIRQEWERHYLVHQVPWAQTQEYLLGVRLRNKPSPRDIAEDAKKNETGLRYKIYYCVRFPEMVETRI